MTISNRQHRKSLARQSAEYSLPTDLVAKIVKIAERQGVTRSKFVEDVLRTAVSLPYLPAKEAVFNFSVEEDYNDPIWHASVEEYPELGEIYSNHRAAVRSTKRMILEHAVGILTGNAEGKIPDGLFSLK